MVSDSSNQNAGLKLIGQTAVDVILDRHEWFILGRSGGKRANFSYHDLSGLSFAKRNLSDADFTGAKLFRADLSGARLDRAILFCVDLRQANLQGASLRRADLRGASMRGARLVGANMEGVDLREGKLANAADNGHLESAHKNLTVNDKGGAILSGCNLNDARLSGAIAIDSDFSDTMMRNVKIRNAILKGANFSGANLELADFDNCDLEGISLKGAVLSGAAINYSEIAKEELEGILNNTPIGPTVRDMAVPIEEQIRLHGLWVDSQGKTGKQLDLSTYDCRNGVSFEGGYLPMMKGAGAVFFAVKFIRAQLQASDFRDSDMRQADFSDADARSTNFGHCRLNHANFSRAKLQPLSVGSRLLSTNFEKASLRFCDFSGANLRGANFRSADLKDARFEGADFTGADFTGADLQGIDLPEIRNLNSTDAGKI